jgi:hypothetical protein
MAINPGTDLLSDALVAADPQKAKAAEDRLARLAEQVGDPALPQFGDVLTSSYLPGSAFLKLPVTSAGLQTGANRSGKDPYEQFEVTVLKSLFELMLPDKAPSVYGSGFAGGVWKSMLAQSLADATGLAGGIGIARRLKARKRNAKAGA